MMNRDDNIAALLQAYIQCQPNPDRIGCPTIQSLEAFLYGQIERDAEGVYDHLPHCRECLQELKTLRDLTREERESEEEMLGAA
jgi:hypothetical protein